MIFVVREKKVLTTFLLQMNRYIVKYRNITGIIITIDIYAISYEDAINELKVRCGYKLVKILSVNKVIK